MDPIFAGLASFGLPGIVIAGLGWWALRQQARIELEQTGRLADAHKYATELRELSDRRLVDAKEYTDRALELQEAVHRSVSKLSELVDLVASPLPPRRPSPHDGG